MELKDFIGAYRLNFDSDQSASNAIFRNEITGEILTNKTVVDQRHPFLVSCETLVAKKRASLGHIVPDSMRAVAQNHTSTASSGNGVRAFNDADIVEYNDWAANDDKCPVTRIIRKEPNFLLFVLRNPIHWKRVKANTHDESSALFDVIFDGPKGIRKDKEHIMRSIGIRINTSSSSKLENMSFGAYAYYDENGNHYLHHPNVSTSSSGKICMGSLDGSTTLGKLHISDIITLMEGVNMTSAYRENRRFYTNDGSEFYFEDCSDLYKRKDMFKPHTYLG